MVHGLAAACLEFCRHASSDRYRRVLEREAAHAHETGSAGETAQVQPIEMPKNSATGFVTAFFAVVTGFALIWHIWWMAGLGMLGAFATILVFAFRDEEEIEIPAEQIAEFDRAHPVEVAV